MQGVELSETPEKKFTWGVEALDELIGRALTPGTTVLLAGNPGAGKTTLAATICYRNAIAGKPCLYTSFYEEEARFIGQMKRYGMDFEALKRRQLFHYIKLPLIVDSEALAESLETLAKEASDMNARVVVIDSFTPLGMVAASEVRARELLQNFFYTLSRLIEGVVVVIAEIPYGQERVETGGVEFVADVALILKHVVRQRLISRILEIRKARGAPVKIAELPFSIIDGKGIVVYAPPLIKAIPPPRRTVMYKLPCRVFEEAIGHVHPGEIVYVEYPPDCRVRQLLTPILVGLILENRLRTLVVSYHRSPQEIMEGFAISLGLQPDHELLRRLAELVDIVTINPSSRSLEEMYAEELEVVDRYRPDLVVFERVEVPGYIHGSDPSYYRYLRDQLLLLRRAGILTIRVSTAVDDEYYNRNAGLSDVVLRMYKYVGAGELHLQLYAWRTHAMPHILSQRDLVGCVEEIRGRLLGGSGG